jgi:hypothetical protein
MAQRKKGTEPSPVVVKEFTLQEINIGIEKLRRRIADVQQLDPKKIRYDDAEVSSLEKRIRETIREIFGSNSPQFHDYEYLAIYFAEEGESFSPWQGEGSQFHIFQRNFAAGISQTMKTLQGLITWLEEKRKDLEIIPGKKKNVAFEEIDQVVRSNLDPFRVIVGVLATRGDSDLLAGVVSAAGVRVDLRMSQDEDESHKTRIRALLPRIFAAYDELDDQSRLAAANVALGNFGPAYPDTKARAIEALARAGWEVRGDALVVGSPDLREMFFPKGSPWDAHVALRGTFSEAQTTLTIVDPYTDGTVFQMLATQALSGLTVRILCGASGPTVAVEARSFMTQYPGVTIEVRQGKDFHDRFIIIDDHSCIHVGASIKDAGKTACMISRVEDQGNLQAVLAAIRAAWGSARQLL